MVQALYERGIRPDLLIGTSAGAINGAFLASRPPLVQTARELAEVWCSLRRGDVFPVHLPVVLDGLRRKRDHVIPDRGLRDLVLRHVELEDLRDATPPLHVVCFDVTNRCEVLLSSGPARDAVIASASIPWLLPPVRIGERCLIDGAVVNPTPISHALALGAERIYVLPTRERSRRAGWFVGETLDPALHRLRRRAHRWAPRELDLPHRQAELIVLPAANRRGIQPGDFGHARSLIDDALEASRRLLDVRAAGDAQALTA
jgi:NTE family protein